MWAFNNDYGLVYIIFLKLCLFFRCNGRGKKLQRKKSALDLVDLELMTFGTPGRMILKGSGSNHMLSM
jgi:hypothetical protein